MRTRFALALALYCSTTAFGADFKASGAAKVYKGSEGEKMESIVVNGNKQIIVHLTGFGPPWEDSTFVWDYKESGNDKTATYMVKRGSKMEKHNAGQSDGRGWTLYPTGTGKDVWVSYSEEDSKKVKADDILKLAH